jgi:hypothetical protein
MIKIDLSKHTEDNPKFIIYNSKKGILWCWGNDQEDLLKGSVIGGITDAHETNLYERNGDEWECKTLELKEIE